MMLKNKQKQKEKKIKKIKRNHNKIILHKIMILKIHVEKINVLCKKHKKEIVLFQLNNKFFVRIVNLIKNNIL